MPTLLIHNARLVVTMDDQRREIPDGSVLVRDHVIEAVGPAADLPATADEVIDARDHVVLPGLVNTHHHMYQSLTRVIAQDCELFDWLGTLYPIWAGLTPEMVQTLQATALISGARAATELGHHPRPLRESVRDALAWYRAQGMLGAEVAA